MGKGLHIAAAAASVPQHSRYGWLTLAIIVALMLVVVLLLAYLGVRYYRGRKTRPAGSSSGTDTVPLVAIWNRFLAGLPAAARPLVGRYPWVVVIGESGAGKTTLIDAKADWQTQSNNKFPSYTAEPQLKLYLGSRVVAHELSPQLVADPRKAVSDALAALWRPLCRVRPPLAVIVLSLEQVRRATPQQLRAQAQRIEGTLGQLSALCGIPILTRVCLTHLEALSGEALPITQPLPDKKESPSGLDQLAKTLQARRVPLVLNLGGLPETSGHRSADGEQSSSEVIQISPQDLAPGPLAARFLKYAAYLKFALPQLPRNGFDDIVRCLASAPSSLRPVEVLLSELVSCSKLGVGRVASTLQLEQLYLMPRKADLQGKNPLLLAGVQPPRLTKGLHNSGLAGLLAALRTSRILSTWHAKLCGALVLLSLLFNGVLYYAHNQTLAQAEEATKTLDEDVNRSLCTTGLPSDSVRVRRAAIQAGDRLNAVSSAERFWPFLTRAFASRKKVARQTFLLAVRSAYFVPQLRAENRLLAYSGVSELRAPVEEELPSGGERAATRPRPRPGKRDKSAPAASEDSQSSSRPGMNVEAEEAMTRIVYALAAVYAGHDGILEEMVKKNLPQVSAALQVSERTLVDYLSNTRAEPGRCGRGLKVDRPSQAPGELAGPSLLTDERQWKSFLADVQAATTSHAGSSTLTRAKVLSLQNRARRLAGALDLVQRSHALGELADALEEECDVDVKSSVGPLGWALVPPEWLERNLKAFRGVIQLVLASSFDLLPENELSLATIQDLLKSLAPKAKTSGGSDRLYTARFNDAQDLQIADEEWQAALAEARRQKLQEQLQARLRGGDLGYPLGPVEAKKAGGGKQHGGGKRRRSAQPHSHPTGRPDSAEGDKLRWDSAALWGAARPLQQSGF